jgi:hypothetical protein
LLGAERAATLERLARLEREFAGIVEASGAVGADDEQDPEGATIAFERQHVAGLASQAPRPSGSDRGGDAAARSEQLRHLRGLCPADSCRTPGRPASEHHLSVLRHSPLKQPSRRYERMMLLHRYELP